VSDESVSARLPRELQIELEQSRASSARLMESLARKIKAPAFRRSAVAPSRTVREMAAGIEKQVRKRPLPAILAAVVAGYLIGRALRHRSPARVALS